MSNDNRLPTRPTDVHDWLLAQRGNGAPSRDTDPTGYYAYLLGMAEVKLADAHAKLERK